MVRPGRTSLVDGVVIEGSSAVNESALTGESIPVDKKTGDLVSAATLNQSGFFDLPGNSGGGRTPHFLKSFKWSVMLRPPRRPLPRLRIKSLASLSRQSSPLPFLPPLSGCFLGQEIGFCSGPRNLCAGDLLPLVLWALPPLWPLWWATEWAPSTEFFLRTLYPRKRRKNADCRSG